MVLGASYRGAVKETAFSGVFATVDSLRKRGAKVLVHDPMFSDEELAGFGWDAYHLGEEVTAAIVQADHAEYKTILSCGKVPRAWLLGTGRPAKSSPRFYGYFQPSYSGAVFLQLVVISAPIIGCLSYSVPSGTSRRFVYRLTE